MFLLVNLLITAALFVIELAAAKSAPMLSLLSMVYGIALLLPSLGVTIRRLHDTGRSGWWLLIGLIPLLGAIVLLVFLATEGKAGANQYGADPKAAGSPAYA